MNNEEKTKMNTTIRMESDGIKRMTNKLPTNHLRFAHTKIPTDYIRRRFDLLMEKPMHRCTEQDDKESGN